MYRKGLHALSLGYLGYLDCILRGFIPSGPELHGKGDRNGLSHLSKNLPKVLWLAHQFASAPISYHLRGRATAIDINDIRPRVLDHSGGITHPLYRVAKNLDGIGPFTRSVPHHIETSSDPSGERLDRDELTYQ
jgi:hypothetical protein